MSTVHFWLPRGGRHQFTDSHLHFQINPLLRVYSSVHWGQDRGLAARNKPVDAGCTALVLVNPWLRSSSITSKAVLWDIEPGSGGHKRTEEKRLDRSGSGGGGGERIGEKGATREVDKRRKIPTPVSHVQVRVVAY
jgi:hypothetical protein